MKRISSAARWRRGENRARSCASIRKSSTECSKTGMSASSPSVRLGLRQIKGFRQPHAQAIVAGRSQLRRFDSVEQFHRATGIPVLAIRRLAEADAFASLGLSRRQALWHALELKDEFAPLFTTSSLRLSVSPSLPKIPLGQEVMTDYATSGLSLKEHPLKLVRPALDKHRILTAAQIQQI